MNKLSRQRLSDKLEFECISLVFTVLVVIKPLCYVTEKYDGDDITKHWLYSYASHALGTVYVLIHFISVVREMSQ